MTSVTLSAVLGASAPIYMAFYVKRRLDYKPYIIPSYVLARESEAVREREALAAKAKADQQEQELAREREQEQARERERERDEVDNELLAMV